ncbi:glycosyl hydrolases family 38 N-terminal domain-containing protein [Lentinula raphanica]|uniref:Alpha-mannosidase n=1 Tax=Lentinula raphanica TaxID=153919 RepID=A0AA38PHK8_9AGAR|nr:glycosyl hydrolases family 38 N-terminal domain-containing protein [Lentinula raphanica]
MNHFQQESAYNQYPELNHGSGAKWIKGLTQNRLGTFLGGHFSDVNLSSVLFTHRLDNAEHVKLQVWSAPGLSKPTFEEAMKQKFRPAKKGDSFGPSCECFRPLYTALSEHTTTGTNHWWKVYVTIPAYWEQYERVQFEFDPGCEAMIYDVDGTPLQGITGGFGGDRRVEYIIPWEARMKGTHEFIIESSCNGMFGVPWNGDTIAPPDMNRYFALASADLVVPNQEAWHLLWDFTTLREIVDSLPGNTSLQNKALSVANEIMNTFKSGDASDIQRCRKLAEGVFGENWQSEGEYIYQDEKQAQIWGIGHCHIDTAWLWPYRVTQQKVARSWATQVDLMERYPEHRFACSQAQQYKWLKQLYPPLFERVKEQILAGKFHPVGGSWVENDSNMPSGEALIRQFVFGQKFFMENFGVRCETAWLPDSFGLTGAYPQLIRGAGMKYFFTQKLSWNNINVFPHSTFNWVGIDGTQVLCHMTPVDTYTAQASVGDVQKGLSNHKNLESSDTSLLVFGNGDGGGGPLAKMLENLRRIRATNNQSRDLPPINMGHSVDEFFDHLLESTSSGKKLPNWHGELYLEFHRGTYTSHGSIKKGNRHSEILLRDVEHVATLASIVKSAEYAYPKSQIDECWEKVLLNQFHDVLPGSAIGMVYEDAEKLYAEVQRDGKALMEEAFQVLFPNSIPLTTDTKLRPNTALNQIIGYNTTFLDRRDIVKIPLAGASAGLKTAVAQVDANSKLGYAIMDNGVLDALVGDNLDLHVSAYTNGSDHFVLRNSSVQLTISKGRITSLIDVQLHRELIADGATGGLVIFEDRPNYWDAWDVEIHHLETPTPLEFINVSVVAHGPLRASVQAQVKYGQSTINVLISLDAVGATVKPGSRSLFRFDAEVDWRERHQFLKFELPLNIHNDNAYYETQFGYVQRPTHKNTTWDMAKFEVCGHKYADLSEYGYGLAILSESKYGFSCQGNVLRISLLRAATAPDAEQDQGEHKFSWAVMPHKGHFLESDVPMAAYLFNSPMHVRYLCGDKDALAASSANHPSFAIHGAPNVFLETIKRGEYDEFETPSESDSDSPTTIIARLYEAFGGHAQATIVIGDHFSGRVAKVVTTNLLEDEEEEVQIMDDEKFGTSVKLNFRGFEVKTLKITLGDGVRAPVFRAKQLSSTQKSLKRLTKRSSWVDIDSSRLVSRDD